MRKSNSPTDFMTSETLSARSYLELSHEAVELEDRNAQSTQDIWIQDSFPGTSPNTAQGKLRPSERTERQKLPRGAAEQAKSESSKTETEPETKDPLLDRPVRKRGRPRLETPKDAAAIEERRMQIRRAQRTYRQKKETTIQTLETRVNVLEQTLQNVSDILNATNDETHELSLNPSQDLARTKQLILAEIHKTIIPAGRLSQRPVQDAKTLRDMFGYQVHQAHQYLTPRSPSPLLNRLFPTTTIYTYSNQESNLSRRLHRFCLEHTYRWINSPHSDPALLTRVFGLFPCIHDMPGVRRAFRRVLQSEIGSPLEGNKLPFYTLGDAGRHFPRWKDDGEPIYPENTRRPGKILRRLVRILRRGGIQDWDEDWSGDKEPGIQMLDDVDRLMSKEDRLHALDLDGDWFDCHDVQGYLTQLGIVLDGSSLWLQVPAITVTTLYGYSPAASVSQWYGSSCDTSPSELSISHDLSGSTYTLDAECFFDCEYSDA
ncbi:hypothetical protein N7478_007005 [Penicillium angulare]|uniref:uncharacterized protein n=1 Tax=Penicillium angulare TaxID=116970 RepID=UPI0025425F3E|nr:uncharacterized protein N7478_007005 [Penicillium angulare]KAJ5281633.1 hypothetical protein N7478_007005 [Penicillium angulare]